MLHVCVSSFHVFRIVYKIFVHGKVVNSATTTTNVTDNDFVSSFVFVSIGIKDCCLAQGISLSLVILSNFFCNSADHRPTQQKSYV